MITRFAPSPTGRLHLGHAFSALQAHDLARARQGMFRLRIEDIDAGRSRDMFVDAILEDLAWLEIEWDGEVIRQSERLPLYSAALERLKAMDLVYPCFCTRAEIAASAGAPQGEAGLIYPGTCRTLTCGERARRLADAQYCWRLDMARAAAAAPSLSWHDATSGCIVATPALHGDVVLARKDAPTSYHLAVTVDDAAQGITDVVRGVDLFSATHVHRLLQALLDLPTPRYHHHLLLAGADGQRLAKRHNSRCLADLRTQGVDPAALVADLRSGRLPIGFMVTEA